MAKAQQMVVFTNQERDTKDLGWWDATGPVPALTSRVKGEERAKLKARLAGASRLLLGSQDDRERPDLVTGDRWEPGDKAGALSARSQPIPLEVAKTIVAQSAAVRGYLRSSPQAITYAEYSPESDMSGLLAGVE